ncbi:MAG: hypothetical protein QOD55_408 [Solirubrobacteraceae bacterium]|jgi:hypothetical protein|nr:hypothetical protein [Solirubrobacteraceae bacterium]MEA2288411.1 hypothetical protein [Solirubrobacteraceae bacterium]
MSALDVKNHLELLHTERALALGTPLRHDPAYMADLDQEIAATRQAFVAAAVFEIARLREALGTAPVG